MALSSQIDAAAKRPRKPIDPDKLNLESPVLSMTRQHRAEEQKERRKAAIGVAAGLLTHPCELEYLPDGGVTRCGHPDHARDAAAVREMLTVLGLAEDVPMPVEPEPTERECTRCRETKPIGEFRHPLESRLTSQCAACRKKFYRPNSLKRKGASR